MAHAYLHINQQQQQTVTLQKFLLVLPHLKDSALTPVHTVSSN